MENTRSRDTGGYGEKVCEPCDDCYNLVSDAANVHRENLAALDSLLQQVTFYQGTSFGSRHGLLRKKQRHFIKRKKDKRKRKETMVALS